MNISKERARRKEDELQATAMVYIFVLHSFIFTRTSLCPSRALSGVAGREVPRGRWNKRRWSPRGKFPGRKRGEGSRSPLYPRNHSILQYKRENLSQVGRERPLSGRVPCRESNLSIGEMGAM